MKKRRIKDPLKINRPFAIFVDHDPDLPGNWNANIVGFELDQLTFLDSPEGAVFSAWEVLCLLTGRCRVDRKDHELSIDTFMESNGQQIPAWRCPWCDTLVNKNDVEEVEEERSTVA